MEIQEVKDLIPISWANQPVLLTSQVAKAYGTSTNVIKENFRYAKEQFEEGVHYYKLTGAELRALKNKVRSSAPTLIGISRVRASLQNAQHS